jgi:hypothetical protein
MSDITASAGESTDSTALASSAAVDSPADNDPLAGLTAFFDQGESSQEGNSDEPDAEPDAEEVPDAEPEAPEEAEAEPDAADDAEPAPEAEPAAPAEPTEEVADFDALSRAPEFLDAEQIKAKFPRNSSKELIEYAAGLSEQARTGHETVERLGGEPFIEPLSQISQGLQEGSAEAISQGIISASGADGYLNFLAQSINFSIAGVEEMDKANPELKEFAHAVREMRNNALQAHFGEHANPENLQRFSEIARIGWLEKITKWEKDGYVDRDEAAELLTLGNDPKLLAEREKNAELSRQLEENKRQIAADAAARDGEADNSFSKFVTDGIANAMNTVVLATSVLRDLPTDTPEMKDEKAFLRNRLLNDAVQAFNSNPGKAELLKGFRQGRSSTATYMTALAAGFNDALLQIKEPTSVAERMLAKIYGNTRNAQLTKKPAAANAPAAPGLAPTQTKKFDKSATPKTGDDILSGLEQAIAAHESS